jgi:hypothetical protein
MGAYSPWTPDRRSVRGRYLFTHTASNSAQSQRVNVAARSWTPFRRMDTMAMIASRPTVFAFTADGLDAQYMYMMASGLFGRCLLSS